MEVWPGNDNDDNGESPRWAIAMICLGVAALAFIAIFWSFDSVI